MNSPNQSDEQSATDELSKLGRFKESLVRFLRYHPGTIIDNGNRKYVVDCNGAWRRLRRDE